MGISGRVTRAPVCVQKCRDSARQVPPKTQNRWSGLKHRWVTGEIPAPRDRGVSRPSIRNMEGRRIKCDLAQSMEMERCQWVTSRVRIHSWARVHSRIVPAPLCWKPSLKPGAAGYFPKMTPFWLKATTISLWFCTNSGAMRLQGGAKYPRRKLVLSLTRRRYSRRGASSVRLQEVRGSLSRSRCPPSESSRTGCVECPGQHTVPAEPPPTSPAPRRLLGLVRELRSPTPDVPAEDGLSL